MALPKFRFIIGGNARNNTVNSNGEVTVVNSETGERIALLTVPTGYDEDYLDIDNRYGVSVDFNDDYIVVGHPLFFDLSDRGGFGNDYFAGAVWIYDTINFELIARREMTDAHLATYPNSYYDGGQYSPNARFGHAVSVSGDVLVVGAPGSGTGYAGIVPKGRVYQYSLANIAANPNNKRDYQYVYEGDSGDELGHNVYVSGNTIAVSENDPVNELRRIRLLDSGLTNPRTISRPTTPDMGSAVIFGGSGQTNTGDGHVRLVAMNSSKVYAGAARTFANQGAGAVFIFDKATGDHLDSISPIFPSDNSYPGDWDDFGQEIIYENNKLIVGAPYKGYPDEIGGIYIYDSDGSNEIIINSPNVTNPRSGYSAPFGDNIAAAENGLIVTTNNSYGLSFYNSNGSFSHIVDSFAGDIWNTLGWYQPPISLSEVQDYLGGTNPISLSEYYSDSVSESGFPIADWNLVHLEGTLTHPTPEYADYYGYSVAIDSDTIAVGAPREDDVYSSEGAIFVYRLNSALIGSSILSPAPTSGIISLSNFYNFILDSTGDFPPFELEQKITEGFSGSADRLGSSVAIDGDTIVAGSRLGDSIDVSNSISGTGNAHIYTRVGSTWTKQQSIEASGGRISDYFGTSVAIDSDTIVVSAPLHDISGSNNVGAAYVFTRSGSTWTQQQKLTPTSPQAQERFGENVNGVDISGDTIVVGSPYKDANGVYASGNAHVFTRSNGSWSLNTVLTAPAGDRQSNDRFGSSVAVDSNSNTIAIGAPNDDANGSNNGAVYVFTRSGSTWTQQTKLIQDGAYPGFLNLGGSLDIEGDTIITGGYSRNVGGAAYVFTRSNDSWSQAAEILNPNPEANDIFGWSVGLSNSRAVIGAYLDNINGESDAGSAYVYLAADSAQ